MEPATIVTTQSDPLGRVLVNSRNRSIARRPPVVGHIINISVRSIRHINEGPWDCKINAELLHCAQQLVGLVTPGYDTIVHLHQANMARLQPFELLHSTLLHHFEIPLDLSNTVD